MNLANAETEMEILKAKSEHVSEIVLLNDAVQKMHAEQHPEVFKYPTNFEEMEKFFRDIISTEDNFIFLAKISDQPVGYVWGAILRKPENVFKYGQQWMYIHQLSVEPGHRRKGVGRSLMNAVQDVARRNGISSFVLDTWEFNKESHAFFEQLGFSCFNINMGRKTAKD
jgi:ribosomal protein S18 acetylase RimI-like enzyme